MNRSCRIPSFLFFLFLLVRMLSVLCLPTETNDLIRFNRSRLSAKSRSGIRGYDTNAVPLKTALRLPGDVDGKQQPEFSSEMFSEKELALASTGGSFKDDYSYLHTTINSLEDQNDENHDQKAGRRNLKKEKKGKKGEYVYNDDSASWEFFTSAPSVVQSTAFPTATPADADLDSEFAWELPPASTASSSPLPSELPQNLPSAPTNEIATGAPTGTLTTTAAPSSTVTTESQMEICSALIFQDRNVEQIIPSSFTVFSISTTVQYQTMLTTSEEIEGYLDSMNLLMSLWMAGCSKDAIGIMPKKSSKRSRSLQSSESKTPLLYSEWDAWMAEAFCEALETELTCERFQSQITVFLISERVSIQDVVDAIYQSFRSFDALVANRAGIVSINLDKNDIVLVESGDEEDTNRPVAIYIGVIAGFIAASLAAILSLLCIIHRRLPVSKRLHAHLSADELGYGEGNSPETSKVGSIESDHSPKPTTGFRVATGKCSAVASIPLPILDQPEDEPSVEVQQIHQNHRAPEEARLWLDHSIKSKSEIENEYCTGTIRICEMSRERGTTQNITHPKTQKLLRPRSTTSYTREPVVGRMASPCDDEQRWYLFDDTVEL